jgi:signal transduction histidine kinase
MMENLNRSMAERNRTLMAGIPIGVVTTDLAGCIQAASPAAAEILGLPEGQLVGRQIDRLDQLFPPSAAGLAQCLAQCLAPNPGPDETKIPPREFPWSASGAGPELIITSTPLRDSAGVPYGFMISFRESAKVRDLSDHLDRTDQLAALGAFTLGLAHELRNPLGAIKGLSQLLQLEAGLPGRTSDCLARMNREVDRLDAFLQQLFDLSERPVACVAPASLAEIVTEAQELARRDAPAQKSAAVKVETALEAVPPLLLEGGRLVQAFARIIRNAHEFTPEGGRITLRAGRSVNGSGPGYFVEISNTGSTIAPENLSKIFEPFFTTRDRATGLGLTIARQIINQNGGTLDAAVTPEGVSFTARFAHARPVIEPRKEDGHDA